ncbi:chorismate-binding protein [Ignatzschineria cameli]|uniref:anthranilate synthase n=2 Tax=Bacteria TaxID=2 RepID=A0A2U2APU4_9GAMM|nr:chorismate-binding protein [Ignatzschineria cameli]PWD85530.1 anthranilate synthase component I [Ignatzschineria cameli]PWD90670.1 anthranilate synthase component I [Ignatzschineria cameli]PWD91373.1 anthranilate synthase component I [Ignatzschineria cameli]
MEAPVAAEIFTLSREIPSHFEPFDLFELLMQKRDQALGMLFESARTDNQSALKSMMITKAALRITVLKACVTVEALTLLGTHLINDLQKTFATAVVGAMESDRVTFSFPCDQYTRGVLTILDPLLALKNPQFSPFIGGLFGYDLVGEYYQVEIPDKGRSTDLCLFLAEELIQIDHKEDRVIYEHLFLESDKRDRLEIYRSFNQQAAHYSELIDKLSVKKETFPTISPELSTDHFGNEGTTCKNGSEKDFKEVEIGSCPKTYSQSYPQGACDNESPISPAIEIKEPIVDAQNGVRIPDRAIFKATVEHFIQKTKAGELLQIVPSRRFSLPCHSPFKSYRQLKRAYPSPYLFYLQDRDFTLFGASPESALKYSPYTRELELYPIAGTKRRGLVDGEIDLELDQKMEALLKSDPKELAEHLMLVDLAQEDLAKVSEAGSIYVKDLLKVDRYRYVMHLVSRVAGRLKEGLTPIDAYLAVMNMGTLTGAPKIEAMRQIYQFEEEARGSYGGAIGYVEGLMQGDRFDSAITIRSAYVKEGIAYVQAGAGIVADSDPESEIEETENKASSVVMAILEANYQSI